MVQDIKKAMDNVKNFRSELAECIGNNFLNANLYLLSEDDFPHGTWKNAGVEDKELYILSENNNKFCLGLRKNDLTSALGWIDSKFIQ